MPKPFFEPSKKYVHEDAYISYKEYFDHIPEELKNPFQYTAEEIKENKQIGDYYLEKFGKEVRDCNLVDALQTLKLLQIHEGAMQYEGLMTFDEGSVFSSEITDAQELAKLCECNKRKEIKAEVDRVYKV